MIGLMKKDFMLVKKQIFIVMAIMAFYFITIGAGKSGDYQVGMFGGYTAAILAILPVTMLGYDEKNRWGLYESSLPVTRKQSVLSKYLLILMFAVVAIAAFAVFSYFKGLEDAILSAMGIFSSSVLISSVTLAISYRFGTDKARFIFIAVCFAVVLLIGFVFTDNNLGKSGIKTALEAFSTNYLAVILFLIAMLVYFASMMISMYVYSKKDL